MDCAVYTTCGLKGLDDKHSKFRTTTASTFKKSGEATLAVFLVVTKKGIVAAEA